MNTVMARWPNTLAVQGSNPVKTIYFYPFFSFFVLIVLISSLNFPSFTFQCSFKTFLLLCILTICEYLRLHV